MMMMIDGYVGSDEEEEEGMRRRGGRREEEGGGGCCFGSLSFSLPDLCVLSAHAGIHLLSTVSCP